MRDSHLIIVDYNPAWPAMFEAERDNLEVVLGKKITSIHHIGSTAVPGLAAKPVIDIMIGVESLADADQHCITPITALGYEYVAAFEDVLPGRRYFRRNNAEGMRTHQIHLWQIDDSNYERHLLFRDYLRAHPDMASSYAQLKRKLIGQFDRVNDYAAAKTDFIRACEEKAYLWAAAQKKTP